MTAPKQLWEDSSLSPERRETFETCVASGLPLERLYTPADPDPALGFPGEYPFTRGIQPTLYRGRLWTMRQYADYATAEEFNKRYKFLLSQGQTGLSAAFDLPTQIGYDADDPMALGEVAKSACPSLPSKIWRGSSTVSPSASNTGW